MSISEKVQALIQELPVEAQMAEAKETMKMLRAFTKVKRVEFKGTEVIRTKEGSQMHLILSILQQKPSGMTSAEILKELGAPPQKASSIYTILSRAQAAGIVGQIPLGDKQRARFAYTFEGEVL